MGNFTEMTIKTKIQEILNATDYIRFVELMRLFDEDNQRWMLHFLNSFLEYPSHNDGWRIFKDEPNEYVDISEEIFDIVDGFICIAKRLDCDTVWNVYGLEGINQ